MNAGKRILWKTVALAGVVCLVLGPAIAAVVDQSATKEVAGHTMRMGGQGKVWLVRHNGVEIDITGQGKKRVELRAGDKLRTEGKAWVLWYSVADRIPHRIPALTTSTLVPNPPPTGRPTSVIYGARRQGNPPAAANRLFAAPSRTQPFALIGGESLRIGAVTVSPNVKPLRAEIKADGASHKIDFNSAKLRSRGVVHLLSIEEARPLLAPTAKTFSISLEFSDGSSDSATFDLMHSADGRGSEKRDILRRALNRYSRVAPDQDEWFFQLVGVTEAYEELGCKSQAASTVLDWWFHEPDNESAIFALQAIAIEFDLGAIDKEFGPN